MKPRIIINADDLGRNKITCSETEFLLKNNIISSASIITNSPYFYDAVKIATKFPTSGFGVHLNLTEFSPLTVELINYNNINYKNILIDTHDENLLLLIHNEFIEQVNRLKFIFPNISHIDSHQHIHFKNNLLSIIFNIMNHFKLNKVRRFPNIAPLLHNSYFKRTASRTRSKVKFKISDFSKYKTVEYFGSINEFIFASKKVHPSFWNSKTIELVCHPGHESKIFQKEITDLKYGLNKIIGFDFTLINYNDI